MTKRPSSGKVDRERGGERQVQHFETTQPFEAGARSSVHSNGAVADEAAIVDDKALSVSTGMRRAPRTRQFVTCSDVKMMRSLVRSGAGVGILSLIDVASDVDEDRLAFVPLSGRGIRPLTLALCVAPQRQLSRAAHVAIDRLVMGLSPKTVANHQSAIKQKLEADIELLRRVPA